jgi:ribose transport system substrate-binding protein
MLEIACAAIAVGVAVLAAVGSSVAAAPRKVAHKSTVTIVGMPGDLTDQFFVAMKCGALAAAKQGGAKLVWQAPKFSVSAASQMLSAVSETKPGGIMLEGAFSATGLSSQIAGIMKQGIPVTIVDTPITPFVEYQLFSSNNSGAGALLAASVNKEIGGAGDVAIITSYPGESSESERASSFEKALKAYPKIHMTSLQYAQANTATAAQDASAMITANPNLKLIYTTDGPMGQGAASAIAAAHKQGSVKLISFDATPQEVEGVKDGQFTGLVAQSPYLMAFDAVQAMLQYDSNGIKGPVKPVTGSQKSVITPFLFIDKQNVDSKVAESQFEYPSSCSN